MCRVLELHGLSLLKQVLAMVGMPGVAKTASEAYATMLQCIYAHHCCSLANVA